jgi:hypothetical protein
MPDDPFPATGELWQLAFAATSDERRRQAALAVATAGLAARGADLSRVYYPDSPQDRGRSHLTGWLLSVGDGIPARAAARVADTVQRWLDDYPAAELVAAVAPPRDTATIGWRP